MTNETQIQDLKAEIAGTEQEIRNRITLNANLVAQIALNVSMNKIDNKKLLLSQNQLELLSALNDRH